ncbi:MAG: hypothetical protein HY904_02110 [Deltaproteobacteria bacterium]|nr:hypothetical protein [Deltaproteobacteria bacterium]
MKRAVTTAAMAALGLLGAGGTARAQGAADARYKLVIRSTLSNAFALQEAQWSVDGKDQQSKSFAQDAAVNSGGEVVLQEGGLPAGGHLVNFSLVYQGTGYGVFSYLKGYTFTLKGQQSVQLESGKEVTVRAVAFEKGDVTTELKDKPALKVESVLRDPAAEAARAAEPPKAAPAAAGTQLLTAEEAQEARLEAIAQRVAELGQRLDKVSGKLGVLQDSAVTGATSSGHAHMVYRNEMGSSFQLREIHIFLDGASIRDQVDATGDSFAGKDQIDLFDGNILPGNHTLNVNVVYQGVGQGVFAFVSDMQFKIRSTHTFAVEQGKTTAVKVVAYESGDARTEIKDRPTVRFDTQVTADARNAPKAAPAQPAAAPAPAAQ